MNGEHPEVAPDVSDGSIATWRRTSPVAIVFFVFRFARTMMTDGLPALAPLVAVFATSEGLGRTLGLAGLGMLAVVAAVGAVLTYLRFRFRVTEDQVLVRRGVFKREQLNLDFDRIQNVSIDEPFYSRPFGLAILNVDTAGSAKKEVVIAGIPVALAREIRGQMIGRLKPVSDTDADESQTGEEDLLLTRDHRDVARYGLMANGLLWVAIVAGTIIGAMGDNTWERPGRWLVDTLRLGGFKNALDSMEFGLLGGTAAVLALLVLAIGFLMLFSVLGALWKYGNYRLTVDGDTYHRHSGILSRQEQTLRRGRVQAAVWRQNFMALGLGRINLQLRMVSAGEAVSGGQAMAQQNSAFLIPSLVESEAHTFTREFFPGVNSSQLTLSRIRLKPYLRKTVLLSWLPPIAAVTIGLSIAVGLQALLIPLALIPIATGCVFLRGKRYGYGIEGGFGCLQSGFVGSKRTWFPLFKIQRIDVQQSPGQRRMGLATMIVHLASHSITVPYLPLEDAQRYADQALYQSQSSQKRWF